MNHKFSTILLFFINPFISVFFVIAELLNKKSYSKVLFSLFMGILGYLTIPYIDEDLVRYYERFEEIKLGSFSELLFFLKNNIDFLLYSIMYILGKLGFSRQLLPFISIFVAYFFRLKVLSLYKIYTKYFLVLLIVILSVSFKLNVFILRNFIAISFMFYSLHLLYVMKRKIGYLFITIGILFHFMLIIFIPIILVISVINNTKYFRIVFIFSFVFLFIPSHFITSSLLKISITNPALASKQTSYLEGFYLYDYMAGFSFKGQIFFLLSKFPYYFGCIYLLVIKKSSKLRNVGYLTFSFNNLLSCLPLIFYRYISVSTTILFLLFLYEISTKLYIYKYKIVAYIYCLILTLNMFSETYSGRLVILKSYPRLMYHSIFTVFSEDVTEDDYIIK